MKLDYTLPELYALALRPALMDEKMDYCVPFNLTMGLSYNEGYAVITSTRLFIMEEGKIADTVTLSDALVFEMKEMNASGSLEVKQNGYDRPLAFFTMEHVPRYSAVAKILNALCKNEQVFFAEDDETDRRCPKCGRPFLRRTHFCPSCGSKAGTLKRLMSFAVPYWKYYVVIITLFWVSAGIMLYQPVINKNLINNVLDPATRKETNVNTLIFYVGLLAFFGVADLVVRTARALLVTSSSARLTSGLREIIHKKIQSLPLAYIETKKTGQLMHRVTRDTERIQFFIDRVLANGVNEVLLLAVVTVTLFVMNWKMALFVLLPAPLLLYVFRIWRRVWKYYHMQWVNFDKVNSFLNDVIRGIRVVKAFGQEDNAIDRFKAGSKRLRDITASNEQRFYTLMPITNCIFTFGGMFLVLYCGNLVINMQMTIGEMVQLSTYASYFYQRIDFITALPRWMNEAVVNAQRVFEVLDTKSMNEGEVNRHIDIQGHMVFDNVTFGYLSYKDVLQNIGLDVKEGEMIGLVGHSGAGKSTLINLIMRMYEPQSGRITIDGQNLNELSRESYQGQLGVVLQETFLFSGTVLANIRYANPDATMDEVIEAAKAANAHDFIMRLPLGYETYIGENGANLSGGERQRIAIARAVLVNPRVLILDEATASVDTETEKQIQEALGRIIKNRTTFAIAHRLSTLKNADRIVVLDHGRIIEQGDHKTLIEAKGKYHDLVMAQKALSSTVAVE